MIIAVVCDVLGEENNGQTVAAMNLIRFLKEKGHEVRVVCPDEERKGNVCRDIPGSTAFVPAAAGLIIAGEVVKDLIANG